MSKETAIAMLMDKPVAPAGEVTPDVTPAVVSESKELDSARFARLAKHEAKIQADRAAFKAEQDAYLKEKELFRDVKTKVDTFESLRKSDPVAALKNLGFTETDIINFLSAEEKTPEQKAAAAAEAKIKEYEEQRKTEKEAEIKAKTELQLQAEATALKQFKESITTAVQSDKDKFEYCNYYGAIAEDLIFDTVAECLKEDQKTNPNALPISGLEAAEMVEKYYEEQDKAMSTLKKRGGAQPSVPKEEVKPNEELVSTGMVGEKPTVGRPMPTPLEQRSVANAIEKSPKTLAKAKATAASTTAAIPIKETPSQKRERIIAKIKSGAYQ